MFYGGRREREDLPFGQDVSVQKTSSFNLTDPKKQSQLCPFNHRKWMKCSELVKYICSNFLVKKKEKKKRAAVTKVF